jgi:hypothetical protein
MANFLTPKIGATMRVAACGEGNFCVAGSFLFGERSITVVPFCLGKASRLDGRAIDEKAGRKEVINTRAPFSRRN